MTYKIIYRDHAIIGTYYYQETDTISSIIQWYKLFFHPHINCTIRVGISSPFYKECTAQTLIFLHEQTPLTILAQHLYLVISSRSLFM